MKDCWIWRALIIGKYTELDHIMSGDMLQSDPDIGKPKVNLAVQ